MNQLKRLLYFPHMRRHTHRCASALVATTVACRHLRARHVALAERATPALATSPQRPSPSAMQLSYLLGSLSEQQDDLAASRTEASVWSADTLADAWRAYYAAYCQCAENDPMRAAELREKDLRALALFTTLAETRHLLALLPPEIRAAVADDACFSFDSVEEFFMHLGQDVEVRCGGGALVRLPPPSPDDLRYVLQRVGKFGDDGRGCIASTGHRVSLWRGRLGEPLGVTIRVGRFVPGAATALSGLLARGSLLIISKAGMGKTTLLRDLAATIANQPHKPRVTIVDTSNEIGGDGPVPLPFLGRCRRIQVPNREAQSRVMTEVIQNHTPEYLVVDELATTEEAHAAWSISQRGVRLIATCHGEHLAGLVQNQSLNLLVGGAAQAFLSNEERRLRNKTKKTVLERPYASPFTSVVELRSRDTGFVYADVNKAVDLTLDDQNAALDASIGAEVVLAKPLPLRLAKLIRSVGSQQDAEARRAAGGAGQSADTSTGRFDRDADGYVITSDTKGSRDGTSRKRSTNRKLLEELSDFL